MKTLKIKVCGITNLEQALALKTLGIDFIGFIFYKPSKRFVQEPNFIKKIEFKNKVGVFVNENVAHLEAMAQTHGLQYLQLHGNESPELCFQLKQKGYTIIKAISISADANIQSQVDTFKSCIDYYLLDTKTENYGGSGKKFNWHLLDNISFSHPFFLSGGIDMESLKDIELLTQQKKQMPLFGIDLNSKFESAAGIKNIELIQTFQEKIRHIK